MKLSKFFRFGLAALSLAAGTLAAAPSFAQQQVQQSSTSRKIVFLLVQSSDHISPLTGATPTVTLSKNGGAFASPAGSVTEVGNGLYALTPGSSDTGTLGPLFVHVTATNADPVDKEYNIVAYNPDDPAGLGLSRLDASVGSRSSHTASDIWAVGTRTVTGGTVGSVTSPVTVGTNNDKSGYALTTAPPTLSQISGLFPTNFSSLLIGTGSDAGKVTAIGGGTGSGASASDIVNALMGTEIITGLSFKRAVYLSASGIPVSEGKPGTMTANPSSSGAYPASVAPFYQDVVYYQYNNGSVIAWTNRTYYKSDQKSVVGRVPVVGTLPN